MLSHFILESKKQSDNHELTTERTGFIHLSILIICMLLYAFLNIIIVYLSMQKQNFLFEVFDIAINKYTLSGILSQGEVIAIILITLNPIKLGRYLALLLCSVTALFAFFSALTNKNSEALPGVVIPVISASISIIISGNSINRKKQMLKVLEYSRLIEKKEKMLQTLAYFDTLTGLPNRKMMMDQVDLLIDLSIKENTEFVLVYLDLDNFKKINDTVGHNLGDEILKQVALRWKEKCHPEDILGRIGGDEFLILIGQKSAASELQEYLNTYKSAINYPIVVERKDYHISASFGITRFPQDGKNAQELLSNADIALYKAKNLGKNDYQFFNPQMHEEVTKKIQLETGLLSAIRNNELSMVYQPQYVSSTKILRGYEALVRWKHPLLGPVSPAEFIPIAEETGIIIEIGRWIIETVLNRFMELQKTRKIKTIVSINISVVQLLESSFVDMIREILHRTGFDSRWLEFEITESVFISSPEQVTEVMKRLKKMGIRIALDDFGTGYASLNYLQILPINILKIDKTFIDRINSQRSLNKMVGAIITLSHQMGIEVVAEGVEREEQLNYLIRHNCDYIQGYYLGRPLMEEQIIDMYQQTG